VTSFLLPVLAAATFAASGAPATGTSARAEDRAIFPADLARQKWAWLAKPPDAFWTPALADVVKLEAGLPTYLRGRAARRVAAASGPQTNPLWKRAPGYKRQYVGVRRRGRAVIYANFFCEASPNVDWHREPVDVDDGGDCYFQVEYDVTTGRFDNLAVNGGA
jgi:hypothetical protein